MGIILDWKTQQKTIEDAQQYLLNPDLTITKNNHKYMKKEPNVKFDTVVLCPFCLRYYSLDKFLLRKGLRVCPNCTAQLKLSTLTEISDLDKFVNFVFNYRFSGFWDKICLDIPQKSKDSRFNEWNKRLFTLGLSLEFWRKYRMMKGE